MKNTVYKCLIIFSSFMFLNCSSIKTQTCNENLEFKKVFFQNIQNVENLIYKSQNESFHNSLKFISKYTKVSWESMANYSRTYPSGIFEEDKLVWLKWYEENKCGNIQFK